MAEKAGAAQAAYNRASLGVQALLALWNAHAAAPARSLAEALRAEAGAADRLRTLVRDEPVDGWPADGLERRLAHFVAEDAYVDEARAAFDRGDRATLGELSASSHRNADALLGNQIVETNALVEIARREGAFAASAFGAGFGGSVWALTPRDEAASFGARWLAAYVERFPGRELATSFVAVPGPPMIEALVSDDAASHR